MLSCGLWLLYFSQLFVYEGKGRELEATLEKVTWAPVVRACVETRLVLMVTCVEVAEPGVWN